MYSNLLYAARLRKRDSAMDFRPDREVEYIVPTLDDPLHTISEEEEPNLHEHRRRQSADSAPRFTQAEEDVKMKFRNLVVSTYDTYMKNEQAGLLPPETKGLTIVFDKNDMVESFRFGDHVTGDDFKEDFRRFLVWVGFSCPTDDKYNNVLIFNPKTFADMQESATYTARSQYWSTVCETKCRSMDSWDYIVFDVGREISVFRENRSDII